MENSEIEFKEIHDFNSRELEQSLDIYTTIFPPDCRRENNDIVNLLKTDNKNYHLHTAIKNNSVVGFSLVYSFENLGVGLLDFFGISPEHQRQGIGTKLLSYSATSLGKNMRDPLGLLIELEKIDAEDTAEQNIQKDRLRFYKKSGIKILDGVDYAIPPILAGETEPYPIYLTILPTQTGYCLSKVFVLDCIKSIYSKVYNYKNDGLIEQIAQSMPSIVKLSDIDLE